MRRTKIQAVETALLAVVAVVALVGCNADGTADSQSSDGPPDDAAESPATERPATEVPETDRPSSEDPVTAQATTQANPACQWIEDSDVVIQLNLPEEYARFNDATVFPSYATGFTFKSTYGDQAVSRRLARKQCDYRVGFSREDFAQINMNPNYPLVISAEEGSSSEFTYTGDPLKITIGADGLPEQGSEFILEVTGSTQAFGHYDEIFE